MKAATLAIELRGPISWVRKNRTEVLCALDQTQFCHLLYWIRTAGSDDATAVSSLPPWVIGGSRYDRPAWAFRTPRSGSVFPAEFRGPCRAESVSDGP